MNKTGYTTKDNKISVLTFSGKQDENILQSQQKDLNGNKKFWKIFFSETEVYRLITSYRKTKKDETPIVRLLLIHLLIFQTP